MLPILRLSLCNPDLSPWGFTKTPQSSLPEGAVPAQGRGGTAWALRAFPTQPNPGFCDSMIMSAWNIPHGHKQKLSDVPTVLLLGRTLRSPALCDPGSFPPRAEQEPAAEQGMGIQEGLHRAREEHRATGGWGRTL